MDIRQPQPGHRLPTRQAGGGVCQPAGEDKPRDAAFALAQSTSRRLLRPRPPVLLPSQIQRSQVSHSFFGRLFSFGVNSKSIKVLYERGAFDCILRVSFILHDLELA